MVKGFKIRSDDFLTIQQIRMGLRNLPNGMDFEILNDRPLEVEITPSNDKARVAMYNDKLDGKKGEATRQLYINIITPFFRQYVRNIKKMEVEVYD